MPNNENNPENDPGEYLLSETKREDVSLALSILEGDETEVVLQVFEEGRSLRDTADVLGLNRHRTGTLHKRALVKMKKHLTEVGMAA